MGTRIPRIKNYNSLSAAEQYTFEMQAIADGKIPKRASVAQIASLWRKEQLAQLGLNPEADETAANTYLSLNKVGELDSNGQLGEEFSSLSKLVQDDPDLAGKLATQVFDAGYLTRDEINKAAKRNINNGQTEGISLLHSDIFDYVRYMKDSKLDKDSDPNEFDNVAFQNYYEQVKKDKEKTVAGRVQKEANPKKWEQETLEEARRTYLDARNKRIYGDIQKQIDEYYNNKVDNEATENLKTLNINEKGPEDSNQFASEFLKLVNGYTEEVKDEFGNKRIIEHKKVGWWDSYKDSAFDDFNIDRQKEVISKYHAIKAIKGWQEADQWLTNEMQSWVSDHQSGLERIHNTAKAFTHTVVDNIVPRMLSAGVQGLATVADYISRGVGYFTGHEGQTNVFGDIASIIATGKDQLGRTEEDGAYFGVLGDGDKLGWWPLGNWGNLSFLRQDYLSDVDAYNTWSRKEQQRAKANGGVSGNEQYVLKPGQTSPDVLSWGTVQDVLGMTSQIVSQVATMALAGGGAYFSSLAQQIGNNGARALMSRQAMGSILGGFKDATITAAPIAESYAYGNYQQTYNGAMEFARQAMQQELEREFSLRQNSAEYKAAFEEAYQNWLKGGDYKDTGVIRFNTENNRNLFKQQYDQEQYQKLAQHMQDSRGQDIAKLAQSAAMDAYLTSFTGEMLKYGMLNAIMNPLKVLKSPNQVLANELKANAYGRLTQDPLGRFTYDKGVPLLGIKKWTTANPKIAGTYNIVKNATMSGGFTNYTDELTSGFAMGYGISTFNSEYLRQYDPMAYANTWHGGSAMGQFMDAIGEGIVGTVAKTVDPQSAQAFFIGTIGGVIAPRLAGRKEMREKYRQENLEYLNTTGESDISGWKKFRQGFNTWVTGSFGEYELTRFGMKEGAKTTAAYNTTLDERDKLFTELAALNQGILTSATAASQNDFASAAAAQDALAMKLLYNERKLSSNPLHQISNQQTQSDLNQLHYIAQGAVSAEDKERMISEALNTGQQTKLGPVSQELKDQTWAEIQNSAKRMIDFIDDYKAEEQKLIKLDPSLESPEKYVLLTQKAELKAQELRIKRDISQLSKDSGIQIDVNSEDSSYGEMTVNKKENLINGARKTIDGLEQRRKEEQAKLEELNDKIGKEQDSSKKEQYEKDALQTRANIKGIDRQIGELNRSISAIENSKLLRSDSGLSSNAVVLDDMLSNPEEYSYEQRLEIEDFKYNLGVQGETYIKELAKLQDQLTDNLYSQKALQNNPSDFLQLTTQYALARQQARNRAIYDYELSNTFSRIALQTPKMVGVHAAISLTPEQFEQFQKEYPMLTHLVQQYESVNKALDIIRDLFNPSDRSIAEDVLKQIAALMVSDYSYVKDNGDQGVADMLEFVKSENYSDRPAYRDAMDTLITDFKRARSIAQSTAAYTEHVTRQREQRANEALEQLLKEAKKAQEAAEKKRQAEKKAELKKESKKEEKKSAADTKEEIIPTAPIVPLAPKAEQDKKPEEKKSEESKGGQPEEKKEAPKAPEEPLTQPPVSQDNTGGLPAGVTRNPDGSVATMTADQQAEQMGLGTLPKDSLIDDTAPETQETTKQQEEVHGDYFNSYDSYALNEGELVPREDAPIYDWLKEEGINLGAIIDDELHNILQVNPKIQLMKVNKETKNDQRVSSNIFLVVEYTDEVAKHHLPQNGGVITSNGKQYLIVGTMWNTKAQDGTDAARLMQQTRDNLQTNGVNFFMRTSGERFYVDPVMNTRVTTFYSGHVINTVNGRTEPAHTIAELIESYNKTHAKADNIDLSDLGFGVITMKEGFRPIGPYYGQRIHVPQGSYIPDKWGQVYVLVPAANGEIIPIFINPILFSEMRDGALKREIETEIVPDLLSEDFFTREQAVIRLSGLLCISGKILDPDGGKGILYGTQTVPTVSLVNGNSIIRTFDLRKQDFSVREFLDELYRLNPRVNVNLSDLDTLTSPQAVLRYDEAGALTTDSVKLGTFGGKYYVAPIDPATGQPLESQTASRPVATDSDYARASLTPVMLPVAGQSYVLRDGRWVHQVDGSLVTDEAEQVQVTWAYKVYTHEANLVKRDGYRTYYVVGEETSNPVVVAYNIRTLSYEGVTPEVASQIIAERRAQLEKDRADSEAAKEIERQKTKAESPAVKKAETIDRPTVGHVKQVTYTSKSGKQISGKYVVSSYSDQHTVIKYEGPGSARTRFNPSDLGLSTEDIIGTVDEYWEEKDYLTMKEAAEDGQVLINSAGIGPEGEILVFVDVAGDTIKLEGNVAKTIYNYFFNNQFTAPVQQVEQGLLSDAELAEKKRQEAQTKLEEVEKALQSPEVQLWSENPWDNITITRTTNRFRKPSTKSRLYSTAYNHKFALQAEVGSTLLDGTKIVYRDKNGYTYIELPDSQDGEVKSAIIVPTEGKVGNNITVHFYTTLDSTSMNLVFQKLKQMEGAKVSDLISSLSTVLMSANENLRYLYYRDPIKLSNLRREASIEEAPATPPQTPEKQNPFVLGNKGQKDRYSIDDMLDSTNEAIMEQVDKIYAIVRSKIKDAKDGKFDQAKTEKWLNFDRSNLSSELERIGISTTNIEDIDSWIDNLENCE